MEKLKYNEYLKDEIINAKIYNPPVFEKTGERLYMNENLLGPSKQCLRILKKINKKMLCKYACGGDELLINELSNHLEIPAKSISINNGSSDMIKQIFEVSVKSGDNVLISEIAWGYYEALNNLYGANTIKFKMIELEDRYEFDIKDIIEKIEKYNPKLLIITSPNALTGNKITQEHLEEILENYSDGILILDEAYLGFSRNNTDVYKLVNEYKNLIIVRTFSKLYALASLRVGYSIANEEFKKMLDKQSSIFGISIISQIIATEALKDKKYYNKVAKEIIKTRDNFINKINQIEGYKAFYSDANFVLIKLSKCSSKEITQYLRQNNYLIREYSTDDGEKSDYIRISVGREQQMNEILRLLRDYKKS